MAEKLRRWLEKVMNRRIKQEFDNIVLVIGDEGMGKSNLITGLNWWWQDIRGLEPTTERTLSRLVWDKDSFSEAAATWENRSVICAMDAARVLYKKDAMMPDQKELEKDLLDIRTKEHLILLGFQEWSIVPSMLQDRRARHCLYIPHRGTVHGYSRATMNRETIEDDDWPEPDLVDTFPYLGDVGGEIGECWDEFKELDLKRKKERLKGDDTEEAEVVAGPKEIADEIVDGNVSYYLSENGNTGALYVDEDMISLEYEHLSVRQAKQVRKLLERMPAIQRITSDQESEVEA